MEINSSQTSNFTQIPNELLENLAIKGLNGTELSIILIVFRKTYGFHEKESKISISYLMRGTGKSRPTITKETNQLVKKTILVKKTLLGKTSLLSINPKLCENTPTSKESNTSKETLTRLVKKPLLALVKKPLPNKETINKLLNKEKASPSVLFLKDDGTKTSITKTEAQSRAECLLAAFQDFKGTAPHLRSKAVCGWLDNFIFWSSQYTPKQIETALNKFLADKYWKNIATLQIFFRRRDKSGESVDRIGEFLQ